MHRRDILASALIPLTMAALLGAIFLLAPRGRPLSEDAINKLCNRSSSPSYNEMCREWHAHVNHKIRMNTDKMYRAQFDASWNRMVEQVVKERTGRDIKLSP